MNYSCPHKNCQSKRLVKNGFLKRKCDYRRIQRFKCIDCNRSCSRSTFSPTYKQKKPYLNHDIMKLMSEGMSGRAIARILRVSKNTVEHRLVFLGKLCKLKNERYLKGLKSSSIQFDELITYEHTKCKPISVGAIVTADNRKILGVQAYPIKASGRLAEKAIKKYGKRKSNKTSGVCSLLRRVMPYLNEGFSISSDMDYTYPWQLKKVCLGEFDREYVHLTYRSRSSKPQGQGELKRGAKDPLFPINHSLAMMRANMSRLIRRSWNTTKKLINLQYHLEIYAFYHNRYRT